LRNFQAEPRIRIESASELREQISAVAHDLRNPLNASMLACELVLAKLPACPEYRGLHEVADAARRALRHADRLIQDLVERSGAGRGAE